VPFLHVWGKMTPVHDDNAIVRSGQRHRLESHHAVHVSRPDKLVTVEHLDVPLCHPVVAQALRHRMPAHFVMDNLAVEATTPSRNRPFRIPHLAAWRTAGSKPT